MVSDSTSDFRYSDSIWCYRGKVVNPKWKDVDTGESHLTAHHLFNVLDELIFCR